MKVGHLHSINPLRGRLTLSSSEILLHLWVILSCQWTVGHRMLVHAVLLEVGHHVGEASLGCRFRAFLLDLVHLLKILLRSWIKFIIESFLRRGLQRSGLGLRHLVDLETAAHCRMHHDFARRLYLLQAVEGHVVEVAGAIQIPLLIPHDLLKKDIPARLPLLLLQQQVVR